MRSLVPLDTTTILSEVAKTGRLLTIEEQPRLGGWGGEIVSMVAEETTPRRALTSSGTTCRRP